MSWLVLVLLVVVIFAVIPHHGYSRSWGYGPSSVLGLILVVLLILFAMGRL